MSIKLSSFDGMTGQNKTNAVLNIKSSASTSRADYYLILHAMLDPDLQLSMKAKMALAQFSSQNWFEDFGKETGAALREKIAAYLRNNVGHGPELTELEDHAEYQALAQDLQKRYKRFETLGEWEGCFTGSATLLNSLRTDTQDLIKKMLISNEEKINRCWLCFYCENLQPFRESKRSLDSNTSTALVNLARINNPASISPSVETMFSQLDRPIYMLFIVSDKRCYLFLRDELKTSQASILAFSLQNIESIRSENEGNLVSVEIETPQDIVKIPLMHEEDARELTIYLREKSVEAIEAKEEFIELDFDKELKKLDMLFKAKAVANNEYIFRKSRLQKMELEKFSDANIEILLARRFADESGNNRFDEQLMQRFTFTKTIMFTDIVGFSARSSKQQLLDTMTLLAVHDKLLMPTIKNYDGLLIKKIGDALMVRFDEALKAVNAAREMQERLFKFNQRSNEKIFIRIGINTGTVFVKNEDVFGDAVNIAARMETLAKPGKIFITEATMQEIDGKVSCEAQGLHSVKGKDEPLNVFAVIDDHGSQMEQAAIECMQAAGIDLQKQNVAADCKPATLAKDPVTLMTENIEQARKNYIQAVKQGMARNETIENWFASFEVIIRPGLN